MKSNLLIEDLSENLEYWENVNLFSEACFQLATLAPSFLKKEFKYCLPRIGSEIDEHGNIRRAIKNFKGFQHMVKNNLSIPDARVFLPRIPKEEREECEDILNFLRRSILYGIEFFPYSLTQWLKYKKVFILDNTEIIKPVNVYEKNYLTALPYSSFVFQFNQPLRLFFQKTGTERFFRTVLISSNGELIDVLLLNNEVKLWQMPQETKKLLETFSIKNIKDASSKFVKAVASFSPEMSAHGFSIEIKSGLRFMRDFIFNGVVRGTIRYDFSSERPMQVATADGKILNSNHFEANEEVEDILNFQKQFLFQLNGFCKLISELSPKRTNILFKDIPIEPLPKFSSNQWNMIPITNVYYLGDNTMEDSSDRPIMVFRGGEKSPHWRRKHVRKYRNPDGTVRKEVWVSETLIREDKLETDNLSGNVTRLK